MTKSEGRPVPAGLPDLLYVVGPGTSGHEELRHSLRSVARNLPHRWVWIVGSVPDWVKNVMPLALDPHPEKFHNIRQSIEAAIERPHLSDEFILMNDDMFIVEQLESLPAFHLGPTGKYLQFLSDHGKSNDWTQAMAETAEWLGGNPLCYEAHTPLLFSKERLRGVLSAFPKERHFLPGVSYSTARAGVEGVLGVDIKVTSQPLAEKLGTPFLSSVDWSFAKGEIGQYVRSLFPEKCRYEL